MERAGQGAVQVQQLTIRAMLEPKVNKQGWVSLLCCAVLGLGVACAMS